MSAPTPAPGDDRPREGYYPDPSIPGYVRYWNGASWVPGTSRPAPSDGLSPGAGASVEETGPHFFDEDPAPENQAGPAQGRHGSRPEPAAAWGADRAHQSGFGGDQDRRVSWGAPDPRVPASPEEPPRPGPLDFRRPAPGTDTPDEGTTTFRRPTPRTPQQGGAPGAQGGGAGAAGGFGGQGSAGSGAGNGGFGPAGSGSGAGGFGSEGGAARSDAGGFGSQGSAESGSGSAGFGPAGSGSGAGGFGAQGAAGSGSGGFGSQGPAGTDSAAGRLGAQGATGSGADARGFGAQGSAGSGSGAEGFGAQGGAGSGSGGFGSQGPAGTGSAADRLGSQGAAGSGADARGFGAQGSAGSGSGAGGFGAQGGAGSGSGGFGSQGPAGTGSAADRLGSQGSAGSGTGAGGFGAQGPVGTGSAVGGFGGSPSAGDQGSRAGGQTPVGNAPLTDPSGPGFGAGKAAAARAAVQAQAGTGAPASAPSGVQQSAPGVPAQPGPPQASASTPMAAGTGGGQPSWAQQVHRLAGDEEGPVAPWKPPVEDVFQAAARRQSAARPAGLGKRLAARIVDTVVLGAVTAVAAVPLGTKAVDHVNEKIDAAKLSGRTETVWLLDGTTAVYLGIVLAVLLLFGVLYEALPTAKWGRTLGKKLCGLEVRGIESHQPPTFGGALRRWLVYSVPGLLGIGVVGVAWCLFDRPWRQCWHDKAARTFVAG